MEVMSQGRGWQGWQGQRNPPLQPGHRCTRFPGGTGYTSGYTSGYTTPWPDGSAVFGHHISFVSGKNIKMTGNHPKTYPNIV